MLKKNNDTEANKPVVWYPEKPEDIPKKTGYVRGESASYKVLMATLRLKRKRLKERLRKCENAKIRQDLMLKIEAA